MISGDMDMRLEERKLSGRRIYTGRILSLDVDEVQLPDGSRAGREVMLHCPGVGVLPIFDDGGVMLVRQYRYPLRKVLLEIPAGKLDAGEQPLSGALRELAEETGLAAERMIYLGEIYPSPGCMDEVLHLYLAMGLRRGQAKPDEDEFLQTVCMPLSELVALVGSGAVGDAKTAIAALRAQKYLGGEK